MTEPGTKAGENQDRDLSVQNEFFNEARKMRSRISILLNNGKRLAGRIKSFDRFAIILDAGGGAEEMIFKHAIATISLAASRPATGDARSSGPHRAAHPFGADQGKPHAPAAATAAAPAAAAAGAQAAAPASAPTPAPAPAPAPAPTIDAAKD